MRKHQQKQILELLGMIGKAQADGQYADCQEGSIGVGEFIEHIEGEGTQTVALLEEYCELLFKASNGEIGEKQLRRQMIKIENSVKNELKPNRIEMAFLSYKASMSDSLESIYLAAKADPGCDAFWIPIPYYDRNPDGSFGKMRYEGAESYGDCFECTDWREYDMETRRPDAIFTFNPYDAGNYVTSVHPDFYCERLRNLTDMLVYVPYFVVSNDVPDHFCTTAGCVYAHKVIVQSETVRKTYVRVFKETYGDRFGKAEQKFVALGSPKFDKAIESKREDFVLPEEWEKIIAGKKAVFYNTSVGPALQGNDQYLKKLRHVFDAFKGRDDVALWWRPHPLNEATYASMRPQLLDEYEQMVADYKTEGWGIYDDTPDLHRAIAWTDAYYGDAGSSLVALYGATGKPVLFQNTEMIKTTCNNNELKIMSPSYAIKDNNMWITPGSINGLFRMELNSGKTEFIAEIPGEGAFDANLFSSMLIVGDTILLTPSLGKNIVKYDIKSGKFDLTTVDYCDGNKFIASYYYDGYVYMIPYNYHALLKYNIEDNTVVESKKLCNETVCSASNAKFFFTGSAVDEDGNIILTSGLDNTVTVYSMKTDKHITYSIGDSKNNRFICCEHDGSDCWLFSENGSIVKWNKATGKSEVIKHFPEGFESGTRASFRVTEHTDGAVFAFPCQANMILKIKTETNEVEEFANINDRESYFQKNFQSMKYTYALKDGDFIYAFSNYEATLQRINPNTGEIECIPLILSDVDYSKVFDRFLFFAQKGAGQLYFRTIEKPIVSLGFFLDRMISEDSREEYAPIEGIDRVASYCDANSGHKVYRHVAQSVT